MHQPRHHFSSFLVAVIFVALLSATSQASETFTAAGIIYDDSSMKPAEGIRIVLALHKTEDSSCIVRSQLTAISNADGTFSIHNVPVGRYVILFSNADLDVARVNGMTMSTSTSKIAVAHLVQSEKNLLGPITALEGGNLAVKDGQLVIDGYIHAKKPNLLMISKEGELLSVLIDRNVSDFSFKVRCDVLH